MQEEPTTADFVGEAHDAAVQRVADILIHPDDLTNKLPMLIKKTAMERHSSASHPQSKKMFF